MIRQRQGIWKAASYAVSLLILGYIALLMIYVSGSNRSFSEMESSMEKVIDTTGMKKLDGQMLKRNFGLNSTDYEGVMYYSSESSIDAEEVLMICVKKSRKKILRDICRSRRNFWKRHRPVSVGIIFFM